MTMLAASGFGIARLARLPENAAAWKVFDYDTFQQLSFHFTHPAWESIVGDAGVSFWDLIQPAFMFMVGVAMPFSYARRSARGDSGFWRGCHALLRAAILVLLGVFLYSQSHARTNWIFTNVLAQIGLGYFFAYLLLGWRSLVQISALVVILAGYWLFFYMNPPTPPTEGDVDAKEAISESIANGEAYEGRFAPWSKNGNAASEFDNWFLPQLRTVSEKPEKEDETDSNTEVVLTAKGESPDAPEEQPSEDATIDEAHVPEAEETEPSEWKAIARAWFFSNPEPYEPNGGGYATLSFIPSIGTTLLGILCGQLLITGQGRWRNLLTLIIVGVVCIGLGVAAHHTICPIVKRIWTPSWVLFSGGYVILMLAAFYFVFDILPLRWLAFPLAVVGMNSIAFYMMGQLLRPWVTNKIVHIHLAGILEYAFGPQILADDGLRLITEPTAAFAVFWLVGLWMYRNRYFVRV